MFVHIIILEYLNLLFYFGFVDIKLFWKWYPFLMILHFIVFQSELYFFILFPIYVDNTIPEEISDEDSLYVFYMLLS